MHTHKKRFVRALRLEDLESRRLLTAPAGAPTLGPPPAPGPLSVWVTTEPQLQSAVQNVVSGETIVIQKGTYKLTQALYLGITHQVQGVTIRGATDNFDDVLLLGRGMDNAAGSGVDDGISVYNAQGVTIADLSIAQTYDDAVDLKGDRGAAQVRLYHDHLYDTGEQIIKSNPNANATAGVNDSSVQYCVIEYTNGTPTTDHGGGVGYTNGIDLHTVKNWVISDNIIRNIHTPDSVDGWGPAVLVWHGSSNVTVERNTFVDNDRSVAFGLLSPKGYYDNTGGVIRNNFIEMHPGLFSSWRTAQSDGQIITWDSPGTGVFNNTILANGNTLNSIQARFTTTGLEIRNNLVDEPIAARDGATYTASNNVFSAKASMFVDPQAADLHLVSSADTRANVIGKGMSLAGVTGDWDNDPRPQGGPVDIGADQYVAPSAAMSLVLTGVPAQTVSGTAQAVTVSARDTSGNIVSGYTGSVSFASSDPSAVLPPHYNFAAADGGAHTFSITLTTPGSQTFSVTDASAHVSATSAGVTVSPAAPTGLAVTPASQSQAHLTWNASPYAALYKVERSPDGSTNWVQVATTQAGTMAYNDGTLSPGMTYYFRVRASASGVDSPYSNTGGVTTPGTAPAGSTYTLWPDAYTPPAYFGDSGDFELGEKFRATAPGSVTGVRFYMGPGMGGFTHVGHLWSPSGDLLATATFAAGAAAGWQQASFASPVPIAAGTTYVVSYSTGGGPFGSKSGVFAGAGVGNGPIRALNDGEDGGDGVYHSGGGTFPTAGSAGTSYYADVVFDAAATAAPTPPPTAPAGSTYTLWPDAYTPPAYFGDSGDFELGEKFRATAPGSVTGVRFYMGPGMGGFTHVGHLWSPSGDLLATATFAAGAAAGWQQASFASPVPIAAGTTYVVSYSTGGGPFGSKSGVFAGAGVGNGPIRALNDGEDGGDGVYHSGGGTFPTAGSAGTSYYADVVFDAAATAASSLSAASVPSGPFMTRSEALVISPPLVAAPVDQLTTASGQLWTVNNRKKS